jgi:hypothetical protein
MHILKITALSAALAMGGSVALAQTQPLPDAAAVVVTQDQIDAIIASCAAGNCGEAVQEFLAASGLSGAALDELISTVAGALVQAAAANPALAAQVAAGLQVAASNASSDFAAVLAQVASAVASGNAASVDFTAIASVFARPLAVPVPPVPPAPTGGNNGSPS